MRKGIKILGKVFSAAVLLLIIVPVALSLLLDIPAVQNYVVQKAVRMVSRKLETTVSIDRVDIGLFSKVKVKGFYAKYDDRFIGAAGEHDLVAGAQNIIVVMTHASKNGESKLLPQCTLPLTGVGCIRRVLTDLALLEIVDGAFVLREVAPGVSPDEVIRKTAGRLIVADDVREMRFS